jgi:putative N6-adenine-specific DNA methylase
MADYLEIAVKKLALFLPCPRGLEPVLSDELAKLGAKDIAAVDGGVGCSGDMALMMRANLHSRVASRVLLQLAQGPYRNEQDIYEVARKVDWPAWFDLKRTIKVKTDGVGSEVRSLEFISLKVKDAVCDRFREATGERPSVDTRFPDIRIHVFLTREQATVYLDTSDEALFKRGWRNETGEAPLRENLAAGLLLLAGYDGSQPLLDPMCGSGTLLIEAADIALKRAPGRERHFAFEKFRNFDAAAWRTLREEALAAELSPKTQLPIWGSDRSRTMTELAVRNLERSGLDRAVRIKTQDILSSRPPAESGLIVTNPPYGVRLEARSDQAEQDALAELYPQLGDWLKQHFAGWTANFFTGDLRLAKLIRLTPKRRIPLYNGALECRMFVIPLVAGSNRKPKPE